MMRMLCCTLVFIVTIPVFAADIEVGRWVKLGPGSGSMAGAIVYSPTRKQVIEFGGLKSGNEVRALDLDAAKWTPDYAPDKANMGGNFYGGESYARWVKGSGRPGPFFVFRQGCWDSTRHRAVFVMANTTAAYDPATKTWTDLKAAFETRNGKRTVGHSPAKFHAPWFAPVPGQWGACCYDAHNDEIVLFPLWRTLPGPGVPHDAGVRAGHYGTFIFDCKTNTWRTPRLGPKATLAARERLAVLINEQREVVRTAWAALVAARQEKPADDIAAMMKKGAAAQKAVIEKLKKEEHVAPTITRAETATTGLSTGQPEQLPALCSQLRAVYRKLRLVRKYDLAVQPLPRCGTGIVYDAKNRVIVMAGGNHLDRLLNDTWVYDCKTRLWTEKAPAPEAANWPGMCYDAKRGWVICAAGKATYAYDAAKDQWLKIGPARPGGVYCDMAYDASRDLYVLNVAGSKYGKNVTYAMKPAGQGTPAEGKRASREAVNDKPFPPPADSKAAERLKTMPANTWVRAKPNFEPTHRSWSTMSWDPALRCVIYQGGGHAGTMNNTVSAYFPESNTWVDAFPAMWPPPVFGNWCGASGLLCFERGVGGASHCRWYESYAGRMVYGSGAGFEWATRERPIVPDGHIIAVRPKISRARCCLHPTQPLLVGVGSGRYAAHPLDTHTAYVTDLRTGKQQVFKLPNPVPDVNREWSAICVHPDKNWLVVHGMGDKKKRTDTATWVLDLNDPAKWRKLDLKATTPPVGMAKLNPIPGTDLVVCAMHGSNDLWVLSLDRQEWKVLPVNNGDDKLGKHPRFSLYGQCVYDPHHKVFVMVGLRGGYSKRYTFLLRPDFSAIKWE